MMINLDILNEAYGKMAEESGWHYPLFDGEKDWYGYALDKKTGDVISLKNPREPKVVGSSAGNDYPKVSLTGEYKKKDIRVHQLVGINLVPKNWKPKKVSKTDWENTPKSVKDMFMGGLELDHINGDKFDYRPTNLRWCTAEENKQFHLELKRKGKK